MRALLLHDKGQWRDMVVENIDRPIPLRGEILVEFTLWD